MIAGTVVGVQHLPDRVRLVVENADAEHHIDVYPTFWAFGVVLDDTIWTQSNCVFWNGTGTDKSVSEWNRRLFRIRQEWDGYTWTLEEAVQGGRKMKPTYKPTIESGDEE